MSELPITLIAPQHGELVPEPLVATMIARLSNLDCGLYLPHGLVHAMVARARRAGSEATASSARPGRIEQAQMVSET